MTYGKSSNILSEARGPRLARPGAPVQNQTGLGETGVPAGPGQAALELAIILPVLIILLAGVMLLGPLVYTNLAVSTAAGDCVTAAAQTLDAQQGRFQGISAAQESLAGFRIRQGAADIRVTGGWDRGAPVTCSVSYRLDLSGVPLLDYFSVDPNIQYQVTLPAQQYKSFWR